MILKIKYKLCTILLTCCILSCTPLNEGVEDIITIDGCLNTKKEKELLLNNIKVNLFIETSGSMSGFMD